MIKFKNTLLNICWDNARFRSSAKRQNSVLTGLLISLMLFLVKFVCPLGYLRLIPSTRLSLKSSIVLCLQVSLAFSFINRTQSIFSSLCDTKRFPLTQNCKLPSPTTRISVLRQQVIIYISNFVRPV